MMSWKTFSKVFSAKVDDNVLREIYARYCREFRVAIDEMMAELEATRREAQDQEDELYGGHNPDTDS